MNISDFHKLPDSEREPVIKEAIRKSNQDQLEQYNKLTYKEEKIKEFDEKFNHEADEWFCCPAYNGDDSKKCTCQLKDIKSFISKTIDSLEAKHQEEIEGIRADERRRMLYNLKFLEILALEDDNPERKEQARLVKEIWEEWVRPVLYEKLGFTTEDFINVLKQ